MSRWSLLALLLAGLAACGPAPQAAGPPVAAPTLTTTPTPSPVPTSAPAPTPTPSPAPTPTADPVAGLAIADLRAASFGDGEIAIGEVWGRGAGYTSYRISYPADGLLLTGLLHVPDGAGPFPVIIANRGTIARDIYQPGMDSRAFSELMAGNGFLVVAPDFRGYGGGEDGPNPFYTGFYRDVLALIPLAQKLPMARPGKVGMWGHSRGASVTVAALATSDQIAAAVAYAPAPADLAQDYARRFRQSGGNPGAETWPFPPDANPAAYRRVSPLYELEAAGAPLQLHHGAADATTDISASEQIAAELRRLGKPVELFAYEGQGHAFQGAAYELYARRVLEFFKTQLGR
ncbi:MAG TPA: alpha/beta fold hydrolase [Herpetosiphonaceae bacterium]